jgi:serine-type D-Ala-D-Ala carboxypeptidase (penicillin-binding protein 5/6)
MGTRSMEARRVETEKLLDWAFRNFSTVDVDWHNKVPPSIRVYQGAADSIVIGPTAESFVTVERGKEGQISAVYVPTSRYLIAPVTAGEEVGNLTVMQAGNPIASIPVSAKGAVARGGIVKRAWDRIKLTL